MRKKMYKRGKFWVVATIAIAAAAVGSETVQADEEVNNRTSSSTIMTEKESESAISTSSQTPTISEPTVVDNDLITEKTVTSASSSAISDSTVSLSSSEMSEPSDKVQTTTNTSSSSQATSNSANSPQSSGEEYHHAATGGSASDKSVETTPSANVNVDNIDNAAGSYDVVISNVVAPNGMKRVVVPTWTENQGQDDIIWGNATKQADGSYRYTVKSSDHKGEGGLYNSHVYIVENDGNFAWGGGKQVTLNLPKASATVFVENVNNTSGTYDVVISNLVTPKGVQRIVVPTWTEKNGQDDILWNNAVKQSDGTYRLTVKASDHKGEGGLYNSHVYIVENDGNFAWGGGKQVTLNLPKASATVSVENVNNTLGTYDVVISNLVTPKGMQRIVVPTWTEKNGQDDILWNNAVKQADGTYRLTIKASDHRWESGKYNSHVYIVESDGNFAWGGGLATTLTIPRSSISSVITPSYKGTGGYDVKIDFAPEGGEVLFAVWSEKNGQDDLHWYSTKHINGGSYQGFFNAQNHKDTGTYNIHAYQKVNGQMNFLAATTVGVAKSAYNAPYYSQRDARWGGKVYGVGNMYDTGCVPTTLAMAISAIKDKVVLPTEIADYLYHNTDTFNKRFAGSSGKAIALASKHWGLSSTVLGSESDIRQALADGHYVTAAVGGGSFTSGFVTHEILLKGNVNGKTYVLDPYTPSNNRWFPISYISSIRSRDKDDNSEGAPFFKITDL